MVSSGRESWSVQGVVVSSGRKSWSVQGVVVSSGRVVVSSGRVVVSSGRKSWSAQGESHGQLRESCGQFRESWSAQEESWSAQGESHGQLRETVIVSSGRQSWSAQGESHGQLREKVTVSSGRQSWSAQGESQSAQGDSHGQLREKVSQLRETAMVSSVCPGSGLSWHIMSSNNGCQDFLSRHMNNKKGEYHHWLVLLWTGRGASGHPTTAVCSNLSGLPVSLPACRQDLLLHREASSAHSARGPVCSGTSCHQTAVSEVVLS